MPEFAQDAKVTWQVCQDQDIFGDHALLFIQYWNAFQTLNLLSTAIPFLVLIGYGLMQLPGPYPKSAGLLAQLD